METTTEKDWILPLIRDNKGMIFKIVNSYCRNRNDREDLAQEIIYELWRSAGHFNPDYKFSTWMCSIALNVAISYYRKGRRAAPTIHFAGDLHLMNIEDRSEGPEEKEGQLQLLQQFIAELGELDKALMILYLEEHSYREIGEVLGISETNVATKISRIKGRLKQKFSTINQML